MLSCFYQTIWSQVNIFLFFRIQRLTEGGLIDKWKEKYTSRSSSCNVAHSSTPQVLTPAHHFAALKEARSSIGAPVGSKLHWLSLTKIMDPPLWSQEVLSRLHPVPVLQNKHKKDMCWVVIGVAIPQGAIFPKRVCCNWEFVGCMISWLWFLCGRVLSRHFAKQKKLSDDFRCWYGWAFSNSSVQPTFQENILDNSCWQHYTASCGFAGEPIGRIRFQEQVLLISEILNEPSMCFVLSISGVAIRRARRFHFLCLRSGAGNSGVCGWTRVAPLWQLYSQNSGCFEITWVCSFFSPAQYIYIYIYCPIKKHKMVEVVGICEINEKRHSQHHLCLFWIRRQRLGSQLSRQIPMCTE